MIPKTRLFTPGPTPLSPVVLQAMGQKAGHKFTPGAGTAAANAEYLKRA